jgi:hypothetical protein
MSAQPSKLQAAAVFLSCSLILLLLVGVGPSWAQPRQGLLKPVVLPLDNGSLQNNLPGNIATLPLFLRNGGHWGFGAGAFGQLAANPPSGGVIIPQSMGLGGNNGGGNILGGMTGCQGGGIAGGLLGLIGGAGGQSQQNPFFPCALQQGQLTGALVQRVVQDGFILQYGVAAVPQVMGGIPTLAVQMGSGFGGLKGNLFNGQQNQQNVNFNGQGGGKIGIGGFAGAYGCY